MSWLRKFFRASKRRPVHDIGARRREFLAQADRLSFDLGSARELLGGMVDQELRDLWGELRTDPGLNTRFQGTDWAARGVIHNGYFPTPDAEVYAAMIRHLRPRHIIEVGGGFSTVLARTVVDVLDMDCRIHVIDPEPRTDIRRMADSTQATLVQDSGLSPSDFEDGTLFFIDSSHLVEPGGDGPFLYEDLIPRLPSGVAIHVHDVFLPYDYPKVYLDWGYGEQYLLATALLRALNLEVVVPLHALARDSPGFLQSWLGSEDVGRGLFLGSSFWMRTSDHEATQPGTAVDAD